MLNGRGQFYCSLDDCEGSLTPVDVGLGERTEAVCVEYYCIAIGRTFSYAGRVYAFLLVIRCV